MRHRTIKFRLTAWYLVSVAVVVTLFVAGSGIAMRLYLYRTVDRDLGHQVERIVPFFTGQFLKGDMLPPGPSMSVAEASIVGAFVQVTDDQQRLLYESAGLRVHGIPPLPPARPGPSPSFSTTDFMGWPLRVASSQIVVAGAGISVHVVQPLHEIQKFLHTYVLSLAALVPLALAMTTTVGYWMSTRALGPVERIIADTEAIDPADLTARLPVPPGNDELTRLARTLNAMLARIERGFHSVQQFTADASHELRAPLSLITTAAEVSLRRQRTPGELTDAMRKIVQEANHMAAMVENLLALARADAMRNLPSERVDLAALVHEVTEDVRSRAESKNLDLTCDTPQCETHVEGNGPELRRLVLILLDNAIKYTEQGSIALCLVCTERTVEIRVTDTGEGIEATGLPHVFDRFWRADRVRSRLEGGTGLGLAIAQQIVQRLGGSITVNSVPGRGTVFSVRLRTSVA